jgi:hypothetical protein
MKGPNPTGLGPIIFNWKMGSLYTSKMIYPLDPRQSCSPSYYLASVVCFNYYELISLASIEVLEHPL